jgi:hypothetical protein
VRKEQTVPEMVEEVITSQAKTPVERSACSFEAVSKTDTSCQPRELAGGPHRDERARDSQVGLAREHEEERHSWWSADCVEGFEECVERLEGKESRAGYYARLEELASLRG